MKFLPTLLTLTGISMLTATPAMAGTLVPGPLLAAGAPALAVFAVGYYVIKRRRGA